MAGLPRRGPRCVHRCEEFLDRHVAQRRAQRRGLRRIRAALLKMLIAPFRATTCAIVGILMLPAGVGVDAQSIDVERSTLTVHVYKTGLFSVFADNHVIRAPIAGGRISEDGPLAVELTMKAGQMTVLDPGLSPDKRAEVQARMRGPEVLDSGRYPD